MRGGGSAGERRPGPGKVTSRTIRFLALPEPRSGPGRGAQRQPPSTPLSAGPPSHSPRPCSPAATFQSPLGPLDPGRGRVPRRGSVARTPPPGAPALPGVGVATVWRSPQRAPPGAGFQGRGAPLPIPSLPSSHPTPSQRATCPGQSRGGRRGGRRGQRVVPGHVPAQAPRPSRCLERGRVPAPRPAQPPRIKGRLRRGETSGRPGRGEPGSGAGEGQRSWCELTHRKRALLT